MTHHHQDVSKMVPATFSGEIYPPVVPDLEVPTTVDPVFHDLPLLVVVKGLNRSDRQFVPLNVGDNLAQVLMDLSPDRWGGSGISLFRNCLSVETKIDTMSAPDITICKSDLIIAYVGPADPVSAGIIAAVVIGGGAGFVAGSIAVGLAIGAIVLGGVVVGMMLFEQPKITTPEQAGDQASGRGALGIPRNRARLSSRIPDIFGYVKTWPDLIAPVLDVYSGTDYSMDIYYCLGIGYYDIGAVRFGDTDVASFTGATVSIIQPEQVPFTHGTLFAAEQSAGFKLDPLLTFSPWVELPGIKTTAIFVDIAFSGGLIQYRTNGDPVSQWVDLRAEYRQVLSPGVYGGVVTVNWRVTAKANGGVRFTKVLPESGSLSQGIYQVRVTKVATQTSSDNIHVHECEVARFAGYRVATVSHKLFNIPRTYIHIHIQSTRQTGASSFEDLNVICSRVMPVLRSGYYDPGLATRRWCDALALMLNDANTGGYAFSEIDYTAILDVQGKLDAMDGGAGGHFNYIYDRFLDVDEQLQSCANAARAAVVQDYGMVTVVRDEIKAGISALITPQNRSISDEGSKTLSFLSPDENDGVEIEWIDQDNDFIKRTYRYPSNVTLINPRKVDVIGLTNWSQVWRRAKYESLKQTRRRRTNTITTLEEGLLLLPMELIEVVEMWDTTRTAEVVQYFPSVNPFQTRVVVKPAIEVNPDDQCVISSRTGMAAEQLAIIAGTSAPVNDIYLERIPAFPIRSMGENGSASVGGQVQVGSRIAIYPASRHTANRWLVGTIKPGDGKCTITLIEYDTEIYRGDTDALPVNQPPR